MPVKIAHLSISQVINKISEIEQKIQRFSSIIGYKSTEISKNLKILIKLSNSMSIVFLYHGLLTHASKILKQALKADVFLFFQGSKPDKRWPGRILLYCNLSYLMLKAGDIPSSLKFLYDAESLLMEIANTPEYIDLKLVSSIIGFMAMCKIAKPINAQEYLESSTEEFNKIIREECESKFNRESCSNIYTIFTIAGEILQNPQAINSVQAYVNELLKKISFEDCSAIGFIQRLAQNYEWESGFDFISAEEFQDFLFLITFFPFISGNTPVIDINEIVREKNRSGKNFDLSEIISSKKNGKINDSYGFLMKNALVKFKTF